MAASHKKVVVRQFEAGLAWGYLPPTRFVSGDQIELLQMDSRSKSFPLSNIKTVAYVWDFNLDDQVDPERIGRRAFQGRPRGEGLWLRLGFRDGDQLEGLAPFDISFIDALIEDRGLFLTPPDGRANAQRIFIPRSALKSAEVLGLITAPAKRAARAEEAKRALDEIQAGLFGD